MKRTSIIVEDMPAKERDNFPKFLAGNVSVIDPLDKPSDCTWQFEFKGQYSDGSERFFIWQIPGTTNEEALARRYLAKKAKMFGLCKVWIYSICKPCTAEQLEYVRMLNETKPWKDVA